MLPGYPKEMRHPAYVQGIAQQVPPKNWNQTHPGQTWTGFSGSSDRFPPVTVMDPNQQEFHESRGYVAVDGSSILGTLGAESYQEYPKFITDPDGHEVIVNSVEEESQVMGHNEPGKLGSPSKNVHSFDGLRSQMSPESQKRAEAIAKDLAIKLNKDGTPRKKPGPPKGTPRKRAISDKMRVTD